VKVLGSWKVGWDLKLRIAQIIGLLRLTAVPSNPKLTKYTFQHEALHLTALPALGIKLYPSLCAAAASLHPPYVNVTYNARQLAWQQQPPRHAAARLLHHTQRCRKRCTHVGNYEQHSWSKRKSHLLQEGTLLHNGIVFNWFCHHGSTSPAPD
jgi:hypothetical protein